MVSPEITLGASTLIIKAESGVRETVYTAG